jgi:hypothetical protein
MSPVIVDLKDQPPVVRSDLLASSVPDARKRCRGKTTDEEYRRFLWRLIGNYDRRIRHGGVDVLADAVMLRDTLEMVIDAGVESCRSDLWSASWCEIGEATRMTRQGAQDRWGAVGGARKPGGQPAGLR